MTKALEMTSRLDPLISMQVTRIGKCSLLGEHIPRTLTSVPKRLTATISDQILQSPSPRHVYLRSGPRLGNCVTVPRYMAATSTQSLGFEYLYQGLLPSAPNPQLIQISPTL